ncbi:uncharacterized protein LOC121920437 isoform X3 [Sceloporus undulatus]|uniref:uncharacterized protein LOC121920437 isoform X3 n=1 Tax=Sceloporus undulatus TaxID=8520 RepID=UPI001C4CF0BE|nr:uncharacterized protein LOC121920437 isoform X3 [Sceloporus undulatus]
MPVPHICVCFLGILMYDVGNSGTSELLTTAIMTHAKSQTLKKNLYAINVPDPLKYRSPDTFRMHITVNPRILPCVVGVATGIQETRSSTKIASYPVVERKAHVTKYNTAIALEKEHQKETARRLEESESLIKEQIQLLDETIRHYTKIIQEQHTQHAELVSEIKKQNEADIKCREEKIAKLKQYISETFQEKSREHQQEINELTREINKFTEKSHIVKS